MRHLVSVFFICALLLRSIPAFAGMDGAKADRAVRLDGVDNNLRTGMGFIEPGWTLEAWIKGNDCRWDSIEAVIAGGDYSEFSWADYLPLAVKEGHLYSAGADLTAPGVLDDKWHHVAVSCDGHRTALYLDGSEVAAADTAMAVIPGSVGVHEEKFHFGGDIDEVRIWRTALTGKTISKWMNRPVDPSHPGFASLYGYYNFDDLDDEVSVNLAGKGHQAFHIRNGRTKQYGDAPIAFAVTNDNPGFSRYNGRQRLFNAVAISSEWDSDQGSRDEQALKLRIAVQGSKKPMKLTELCLDFSGTDNLADIDRIHLYYTGGKARSEMRREIFGGAMTPERRMTLRPADGEVIELADGLNYFLLTFDVNKDAALGDTLLATVPYIRLDGKKIVPECDDSDVVKQVTCNNPADPGHVKVFQWNIWHGGNHLGTEGQQRIKDLIKATHADVVMLQESYGIQPLLIDSLGFNYKTASLDDNLSLYTRFPLEGIDGDRPFYSNPAKITLPGGKRIMLVDCWLRYAYRPEYTGSYPERGLDPSLWVKEDSTLAMADVKNIYDKDITPNLEPDMPVILTGDFNSCSHLDWTERTKDMHFGYGPVAFPASRFMLENGFKDSFREKNPDELKSQGSTWAVILGQTQAARIDFIYYKGDLGVQSSKIVRTSPEIDYVWPSDHAAVLTVFKVDR